MATDYSVTQIIQAPLNRVAELLRTTLAQHSFRIDLVNDEFCELTAQLVKNERVGNTNWNYEYHFLASWEPLTEGVNLLLKMNEKKNKKDSRCKTYCDEIMQGVLERAAKLQVLEKTQEKPSRYGTARWATLDDVKEAGYWGGYEDSRRFII